MGYFHETDFRVLIRSRIEASNKGGRGRYAQLARFLGIHSTSLSQIMAGKKELSMEHAALVCDFFELTELESDYFLGLVQLSRAGHKKLREKVVSQLEKIRLQSTDLSKHLPTEQALSNDQKAVFYSSWAFSAIRVLSSIEGYQSIDSIAERLRLSKGEVTEKMRFLLSSGLCTCEENGAFRPGPNYTHLEANSPFISKHHSNWRVQAMLRHSDLKKHDLAYSSLMSISEEHMFEISEMITDFLKRVNKLRASSNCEALRCLAIDWIGL